MSKISELASDIVQKYCYVHESEELNETERKEKVKWPQLLASWYSDCLTLQLGEVS